MTDDRIYYLLRCRTCDDGLPTPFPSPQARGEWARKHTEGTGHDDWWVADQYPAEPTRLEAVPGQQIPPGGAPVQFE